MAQLTRRTFLRSSGAVGVALAAPALLASCSPSYKPELTSNPLGVPPLLAARPSDGADIYTLGLGHGETEFFKGLKTPTIGVNGSYLGPTLRLTSGNHVRFDVTNNLNEDATVHWHGFHLPAAADGGPHQAISPGATWSPQIKVHERAGLFWYHSHMMGQTGAQVWAGLAGLIIVEDAESSALDLPSTYGLDDIPLVLQDRTFTEAGEMPYGPGYFDRMDGMLGNVPLTNGTIGAFLETSAGLLRLRLLNGSNATFYGLHFADGRSFLQIASDGGLLERPFETSQMLLSPGERAEILVDLSDGKRAILRAANMKGDNAGKANERIVQTRNGDRAGFTFLEIRPSGSGASARVPETLASLPAVNAGDAVKTRTFQLDMGLRSHSINGVEMDMALVNEVVPVGQLENWEITNKSWMAHPFHIHNTQFRILDRDGKPPHPGEAGLKDTVVAYPKEVLRLLVRFDNYTDPALPYMYHCHVLEHEDAGMMGQFTVV